MSLPPSYQLDFYSADNESLILNWKNPNGTPIDLDGTVVVISISKDFESVPLIEREAVLVPAEGRIEFGFTPEELQSLLSNTIYTRETLWYEIRAIYGTQAAPEIVKTMMRGNLIIHKRSSNG